MESFLNCSKVSCCIREEEQDTKTQQQSTKGFGTPGEGNKAESTGGTAPSSIHINRKIHIDPSMNQKMTTTTNATESLPRLPIPTLSETIARFIEVVTPLLSPAQLNETKEILKTFQKSDGDGPKLQSLLESYDEEAKKSGKFGSYIEEFWNNAYLVPDDPLVLNLNPYFLLEEDADAKIAKDQILRASALTFNSLKFCASLKNGTMTPDLVKGKKICMAQFNSLFGSCRIPKEEESDIVVVDEESAHVIVMFRNQIYHFKALSSKKSKDDEVKVAVNEADIAHILHSIVKDGKKIPKAASIDKAIGVLTTLPRSSWARARNRLTKLSQANKKNFEIINSALFVLALDEFVPTNVHEAAANMLHGTHSMVSCDDDDDDTASSQRFLSSLAYQGGTCCNRFYDKLQIIVCEDGSAGINFEHSAIDGHTALRFVSDVFAQTVVAFAKSVTKSIYRGDCPIPSILNAKVERAFDTNGGKKLSDKTYFNTSPDKLTFDVDEDIHDQILFAESKLGDAVKADDTYILEFKRFGKNLIIHNSLRYVSTLFFLIKEYCSYSQIFPSSSMAVLTLLFK